MSYYYEVSTFELKTHLAKYLRALKRGYADDVIVMRYGRPAARLVQLPRCEDPALPPESEEDLRFYTRARYRDDGAFSRRTEASRVNRMVINPTSEKPLPLL